MSTSKTKKKNVPNKRAASLKPVNPLTPKEKARKIWYYFPLPIFFNIAILLLRVVALYNKSSFDKLYNSGVLSNGTFTSFSMLLTLLWIGGNIISVLVSPIIYEMNKKANLKNMNLKKIFILAISVFLWLLITTLLSSGIKEMIVEQYRVIVTPVVQTFSFGYTYSLLMLCLWLAKRKKK